jgi:hypothetical protein
MECIEMPGVLQASGRRRKHGHGVSPYSCLLVLSAGSVMHCDGIAVVVTFSPVVLLEPPAMRIFGVDGYYFEFDLGSVQGP